MKKDTYYFSHDFNAHNDFKILFLRQQLGMEGYGIYWFLIESLADSGGILPMKIIPILALQMHTTEVKVQAVIKEFELFEITEESFCSQRLLQHLKKRFEIKLLNSEKGRLSAEKRKQIKEESTAVEQRLNCGSTKEKKVKEKKGNEIKINESLIQKISKDLSLTLSIDFNAKWGEWLDYKSKEHRFTFKTEKTQEIALKSLLELSLNNEQNAIQIINQSIANGWKGFFKIQNQKNETTKSRNQQTNESLDYIKSRGQEIFKSFSTRTTDN